MTTTALTTTVVDRFLAAIENASVTPDLYAAGARLDAVVPGWRFGLRGGDDIAAEYAKWFAHPARLEELRRLPTPTGEVVEYTATWTENGIPHAGRHVHILEVDTDRILRDHVWCGGRWPAALLAEMGATDHAG